MPRSKSTNNLQRLRIRKSVQHKEISGRLRYPFPPPRCSRGCSTNTSVTHYFTDWLSDPFPPNLQSTVNPKPLEVETWHFYTMFTNCHVSPVTCHMSHVMCLVSPVTCQVSGIKHIFLFFVFLQIGEFSWWRVGYQRGLPRLVCNWINICCLLWKYQWVWILVGKPFWDPPLCIGNVWLNFGLSYICIKKINLGRKELILYLEFSSNLKPFTRGNSFSLERTFNNVDNCYPPLMASHSIIFSRPVYPGLFYNHLCYLFIHSFIH